MEKTDWDFEGEYTLLVKRYTLPSLVKLSEDFDVEKVSEKKTSFILREMRRAMTEKLSAYLHLLENLLNPTNPPMFIMSVLRKITPAEKDSIKEVYKKISLIQLKSMRLDTMYSEKEEALFITSTYKDWQDMKKILFEIISTFDEKFEESPYNGSKGYLG